MPTADASLWNMAGLNEKIGRLLQARVYYSDFKNWRECFFFTIVWYLIIGRWCSLWAEIKNSPSGGSSTNQDNKGEFWAGDLWKSITGSRGEVMNTSSQAYIIQASLRLKPVLSSSPSTWSNNTNNNSSVIVTILVTERLDPHFWCKIAFLLVPSFACQPLNGPPVSPGKTEPFTFTFWTWKSWPTQNRNHLFHFKKCSGNLTVNPCHP